ncbi:MAG: leucyl aminopeptidase family protein [Proteobacteria bacterium]|nr:leucyl aminopeptidase family protein [Pseudomonadota bacterium]
MLIDRAEGQGATPLWLVSESMLPQWRAGIEPAGAAWIGGQAFQAERARVLALPTREGGIAAAVLGLGALADAAHCSLWDGAAAAERLPAGDYALATALPPAVATQFALGWLLGCYRYNRFRSQPKPAPAAKLVLPEGADGAYAKAAAEAIGWARDLVNTPANELGPAELAEAARGLAREFGGQCETIEGEALRRGYPLVAAVGQGSERAPRLIDCRWPRAGAPRVTLVGKGVCFDSGGLDLKPSAGMLLMKKDMGGAACALGLTRLLLAMRAPIQLRLLIPAVENSVSGAAYRPGDVWSSRKGLTVEIGNTDAEGRLVLADALADADAERPDLLIDLATLTGAARTALGPDLPALFANAGALAEAARAAGESVCDPLWPMPLWGGYDEELASRVADLNNVSAGSFAGAIIAALFLKRFVTASPEWLHVDLYAWNPKDRPGRPQGAEAQGLRALYALIRRKFG